MMAFKKYLCTTIYDRSPFV